MTVEQGYKELSGGANNGIQMPQDLYMGFWESWNKRRVLFKA